MKDYDKHKGSSNLKYWDVNNIYGLAMLQNLPVNIFKTCNEEIDAGYFL